MDLTEKIRRSRAGRSYAEIARAAGCSAENIRKLEAGISEPGFRLGVALAGVLGVPVGWLADDAADWPPPPASLDDKVVRAVREALSPYGGRDSLSAEEQELLSALRERGIRRGGDGLGDALYAAIFALLDLRDAAIDAGGISAREAATETAETPASAARGDEAALLAQHGDLRRRPGRSRPGRPARGKPA